MKYLFVSMLSLSFLVTQAQTEPDSVSHDEVRSLVSFYKYMLNTIGSGQSSTRDKEVIITQSFKKIFSNKEVQIEDDLVLDRSVITNKDVSSYLRDVDFFFSQIRFEFENIEIEKVVKENGAFYFLASLECTSIGTSIEGKYHSNTKKRFIEVNLDEDSDDLKIVSIYTTKISRDQELQLWWNELSFDWVNIFKNYVSFKEVSKESLLKIASIDSLNLSGNQFISDLEPLSILTELKHINISHTRIADLNGLRFSRDLKELNISQTAIDDLEVLQYFENLKALDLSQTKVINTTTISRLQNLSKLDMSQTSVTNFDFLKSIQSLKELNLASTSFNDPTLLATNTQLEHIDLTESEIDHLFVLTSLPKVKELNVSNTKITNLNGLEDHPNLEILRIDQTTVKDLNQVTNTPNLTKIYADETGVSTSAASVFMTTHSQAIVVTNSQEVLLWWSNLPENWKMVLGETMGTTSPSKEVLTKLLTIDSLNVSNKKLYTTEPLKKFKQLRYLDISFNDFGSLNFTSNMNDLEVLIAEDISIETVQGLGNNTNLQKLILRKSKVENISSISHLPNLKLLDLEDSFINENQIVKHLEIQPNTVIIYQTDALQSWWDKLSPVWQSAFELTEPNSLELHQLIEQKEISIASQKISDLTPLDIFINLQSVSLDKVRISNLNDLYKHKKLQSITYSNGPLQTLEGMVSLEFLRVLNIPNTAIEDLKGLYNLSSLRHLNCAGTNIKNLRGLDELNLESLDLSNTRIWRLERLYNMSKLKYFVCNNTRLSQAKVDAFQLLFPACEITFY